MDGMTRRDTAIFIAIVTFTALVQMHLFYELHRFSVDFLQQTNDAILNRTAPWRAYQNRLLGPFLIDLCARLLGSTGAGFFLFSSVMIFLNHLVAGWLSLRNCFGRVSAYLFFFMFALSYVAISHLFSYPWDQIEVLCFMLFSYLVIEKKSVWYVLPLFLVALVNRESAALFGCWYVIDMLVCWWRSVDKKPDYKKLCVGLTLIGMAAFYTKITRDLLFHPSSQATSDLSHRDFGNHFALTKNLMAMQPDDLLGKMWFIIIASYICWYVRTALRGNAPDRLSFGVLLAATLVVISIFGIIGETRVFYTIQPMIFISLLLLARDAGDFKFVRRDNRPA